MAAASRGTPFIVRETRAAPLTPKDKKKRATEAAPLYRRYRPAFGLGCSVARSGSGSGRSRIRLGNADVAADGVLANFIDDKFLRDLGAMQVEEDRFVHGAVLLLEQAIFGGQIDAVLLLLFVDGLEFDGDIANLLRLVLAGDGELDVIAFAEAAKLVNFIVVARDECAHLAAGHLEIFAGGIEVRANDADFGVNVLHVLSSGLGRQLGVDRSVESRNLTRGFLVRLGSFIARLLELALGNLELAGNNFQFALKVRVRLLGLHQTVLQRGHVLLNPGL